MASLASGAPEVRSLLENDDSERVLALREMTASVAFLKSVSGAAVKGVTVLNIFRAICGITWSGITVKFLVKAMLIGLSFSTLPILLMVHNIVKVAEKGGCSLDFAATLVLLEFIYVYLLGAVMMVMAGASCIVVTFITALMICIVMLLWSHVFTYPKMLRKPLVWNWAERYQDKGGGDKETGACQFYQELTQRALHSVPDVLRHFYGRGDHSSGGVVGSVARYCYHIAYPYPGAVPDNIPQGWAHRGTRQGPWGERSVAGCIVNCIWI